MKPLDIIQSRKKKKTAGVRKARTRVAPCRLFVATEKSPACGRYKRTEKSPACGRYKMGNKNVQQGIKTSDLYQTTDNRKLLEG